MIARRRSLLLAAVVLALPSGGCTRAPAPEEPSAPPTEEGSASGPEAEPDTPLLGEASRPGGPASHDGCAWVGTYMGRFGAEVPQVGGELVTVRLSGDQRWFVESASGKVRGEWTRQDEEIVLRETLAIGAGTDCGDTSGTYVFGMTNDCRTAALSLVEDACTARSERLHQLVLERRSQGG